MNRFKKELMLRGIKLEHQYPVLPFEENNGVFLDSVIVNSEAATVTSVYNIGAYKTQLTRGGDLVSADYD